MSAAQEHRVVAAGFTQRVRGTTDWTAPAPVAGWTAVDVVDHLVTWLPAFLAAGGVDLPSGPSVAADPVAAWQHQVEAVQQVLDSERSAHPFTHPRAGTHLLGEAIENFYVTDVFLHTWDLARATGQDDRLDENRCATLLAGLVTVEDLLRSSGQYGPAVPVSDDADVQTRLVGFIGRDPAWRP